MTVPQKLIQTYTGLGNSYREKQNFEYAINYFELALKNKILQRGEHHKEVTKIYNYLNELYYLIKNNVKGNFNKEKSKT